MVNNETDFMLTTYDNPFNPFEDFEAWWKYDLFLGHDCCGTLAREALTSDVWSDEKNDQVTMEAMDRIVENEPLLFKKVSKDSFKDMRIRAKSHIGG